MDPNTNQTKEVTLETHRNRFINKSNYNIVTGPNVDTNEKLTIHLDEVPISQAINLIIRASGLSYEIIGNSILVANKSKLNSDVGVKPHVIHLEYANAQQVADLLINITESITIDFSGNNLLVSASPKKINEISELNIGHFLIGESIYIGLEASIKKMRKLIDDARP